MALTRRGFFGLIAAMPVIGSWKVEPTRVVHKVDTPDIENWYRVEMKPIDFYPGRKVSYLSTLPMPKGY